MDQYYLLWYILMKKCSSFFCRAPYGHFVNTTVLFHANSAVWPEKQESSLKPYLQWENHDSEVTFISETFKVGEIKVVSEFQFSHCKYGFKPLSCFLGRPSELGCGVQKKQIFSFKRFWGNSPHGALHISNMKGSMQGICSKPFKTGDLFFYGTIQLWCLT